MMQKRITWKLEKRNLQDLKPHAKNPRQFTEKGMKDLEKSINSIGFMQPININQDGTILSGHARTLKLKEMGEIEVDVYVPDRLLTPKQEEEVLVRANANTAGQWDFEILANEFDIDEINEWGLEVPDMEVEELEAKEDDFDGEPPVNPKTVLGDLYEIGEHRLLCGDSTIIDNVEKLMGGGFADMVFTDPPYNTGMTSKTQAGGNPNTLRKGNGKKSGSTRLSHMFDDDYTDEEWNKFLNDFINSYFLFVKDDSVCYICLDWRRSHELVPKAKNAGFKFSNLIVWDKMVHGLGSDYKYTHEFLHVFKKGKPELKTNQGEQDYQDIWHIQRKMGKDEEHATKKPIELCERAINHASKKNDLVLDLFLGSGSTMVASHQLKRKCYGMELDPKYCDVIVKRMIKLDPSLKLTRNGEDCKNEFMENNG
jgi:DNA modification methylase